MVARGTFLALTSRVIAITSVRRYNDGRSKRYRFKLEKKAGIAGFSSELRQMQQLIGCPSAP